jgi:hypothetical protein
MRLVLKVVLLACDSGEQYVRHEHRHQLETEEKDCGETSHPFYLLVFVVVVSFKSSKRGKVNCKANHNLASREHPKDSDSVLLFLSEFIASNNEFVETDCFSLELYHALQ